MINEKQNFITAKVRREGSVKIVTIPKSENIEVGEFVIIKRVEDIARN